MDVRKLHENLKAALKTKLGDALDGYHMKLLSFLVALCGTDFSRQLPFVTPPKLWEILQTRLIASQLISSFDTHSSQIVVERAVNGLVGAIYKQIYSKHCHGDTMDMIISSLIKSKLSENTKKRLPSAQRVNVTIRNANWLLIYWECKEPEKLVSEKGEVAWDYSNCFPNSDTTLEDFGFTKSHKSGAVQWLDVNSDAEESDED